MVSPRPQGLETALKVHDAGYLDFLSKVWRLWKASGAEGEAIATSLPVRRSTLRIPNDIDGMLGYYANATETSITDGTYEAALSAMHCALDGADWLNAGNRFAFALCRPPGHHAGIDLFGGYCFINNAAVAAERLIEHGAKKVAILDVDFHHGNGTQDITYQRSDIFFASLHGEPANAFPISGVTPTKSGQAPAKGATPIIRCRATLPGRPGLQRSATRSPASRRQAPRRSFCRSASIRSSATRSPSSG